MAQAATDGDRLMELGVQLSDAQRVLADVEERWLQAAEDV